MAVLGLLINIAEVPHLRTKFMKIELILILRSF